MAESIIGFDVRMHLAGHDPLWDAARRARNLLRQDVPRPLSADPWVWPSLFYTGEGIGFSAAERRRLGVAGLLAPAWIEPNAGE